MKECVKLLLLINRIRSIIVIISMISSSSMVNGAISLKVWRHITCAARMCVSRRRVDGMMPAMHS